MDLLILVTLGTNDKSFIRLIKKVEDLIRRGILQDQVVVQAGFTKYDSIPMEEFASLMEQSDLIITHGGVGSIISGLKNNKKIIALPRLEKYGEHVNDHQLQIIENFANAGFILPSYQVEDLEEALSKVANFQPKTYKSNTENMISLVKKYIDK